MPIKVLFHSHDKQKHCPDGFAAALAFYMQYGDSAEYIPVLHQEPPPALGSMDSVYIVDFSYPRETLERLKSQVHSLYVLDHHKTAEEALKGLDYCHFNMHKSGAMLAWEHVHQGIPAPALFAYVQDRDLWQWKLGRSKAVCEGLDSIPKEFSAWAALARLDDKTFIDAMVEKGEPLLAIKQSRIEALFQLVCRMNIGYPHPDASIPVDGVFGTEADSDLTSELCNYIIEKTGVPMAAYAYERLLPSQQTEYSWSLRSQREVDVSAIAKSFGGGGHKNAAGFKFTI